MKKLLSLLAVAFVAATAFTAADTGAGLHPPALSVPAAATSSDDVLAQAFEARISDIVVEGRGVVERVLPDDEDGSRHQRFILRLASGQTLLMSHNIDLAPRIDSLSAGDAVAFRGEYEWNAKGGVIHWTHHDPAGRRPGGWLEHGGKVYR